MLTRKPTRMLPRAEISEYLHSSPSGLGDDYGQTVNGFIAVLAAEDASEIIERMLDDDTAMMRRPPTLLLYEAVRNAERCNGGFRFDPSRVQAERIHGSTDRELLEEMLGIMRKPSSVRRDNRPRLKRLVMEVYRRDQEGVLDCF